MYCLNLLGLALELAKKDSVYEDVATKFFEHFVYIGAAINHTGRDSQAACGTSEDGYYYDVLRLPDGRQFPIRAQTISGLIPIFAGAVADREAIGSFGDFSKRLRWFAKYRPELLHGLGDMTQRGVDDRVRLAIVDTEKLSRILAPGARPRGAPVGPRHPLGVQGIITTIRSSCASETTPSRSSTRRRNRTTSLFGGNSNWRGPVWFPLNYLLIEALQKHDAVLGDSFKIECPTGSGCELTLWQVTTEITRRLITLFTRGADGRRPVNGGRDKFDTRSTLARPRRRSTSTSTATPAKASAPRTRPAGQASWPSSSTSMRNTR